MDNRKRFALNDIKEVVVMVAVGGGFLNTRGKFCDIAELPGRTDRGSAEAGCRARVISAR
jgi:hypothetical protein